MKKLTSYDLLNIDDVGYVQQAKEEMEVLFTLLADCYETTSIFLTSNLPFSKWEGIFKDAMMAAAAIDRLVHHSTILELNLPSYRLEKFKNKKNKIEGDDNKKNTIIILLPLAELRRGHGYFILAGLRDLLFFCYNNFTVSLH